MERARKRINHELKKSSRYGWKKDLEIIMVGFLIPEETIKAVCDKVDEQHSSMSDAAKYREAKRKLFTMVRW